MAIRRSFTVVVVAFVQLALWTPYLFWVPWTLPHPTRFGRYVVWSGFHFDLGTATDFIPAVAMVVAGVFAMIVGLRRNLTSIFVIWAIRVNAIAILVLTAMEGIGSFVGVIGEAAFDRWLLLTVVVWFGPPVASIVFMRRRKQLLEHGG